jgi:hypothetical protein
MVPIANKQSIEQADNPVAVLKPPQDHNTSNSSHTTIHTHKQQQ